MELIYGNTTQEVQEIDILQNMSQKLANSIATGPQDAFFASLDRFNDELRYQGLDSIDVTGKWNWKPGTYNVIKETVQRKLQMHKKCKGIYHFLQRTKDYSNYMSYILTQAAEMERLKRELKDLGVQRNVNIEEFQEKANVFTNTVKEQCDLAYDASGGRVDIHPYFQINNNTRNSELFFEICIRDLVIDVYDGRENSKCIQRIDSGDSYIRIIARASFRHLINDMKRDIQFTGMFISDLPLRHPYISTNHYNSSQNGSYGTVCLDKYRDDVYANFRTINFVNLQHNLLSWAQYYHTQYSNPYNNIKYFHIGMPGEFSNEYGATVSNIVQDCTSRLSPVYKIWEGSENCKNLTKACESINCVLMISCSLYNNARNVLECDTNTHYQYESIIGWLAERLEAKDNHSNYDLKDTIDDYLSLGHSNTKSLSELLNNYIHNAKLANIQVHEFTSILLDWGYWLTDKDVEKLDESNEEGIKEQMKAWATSPGRR